MVSDDGGLGSTIVGSDGRSGRDDGRNNRLLVEREGGSDYRGVVDDDQGHVFLVYIVADMLDNGGGW